MRALQAYGGSEFAAEFETACHQGPALVRAAPALSQTQWRGGRRQRTPTEEFYQVTPCSLGMKNLNRKVRQWEKIYNTVRPHQLIGYLTPQQFLLADLLSKKE